MPRGCAPGVTCAQRIICPSCGATRDAEVTWAWSDPLPALVHECACGYIIGESEWTPAPRRVARRARRA